MKLVIGGRLVDLGLAAAYGLAGLLAGGLAGFSLGFTLSAILELPLWTFGIWAVFYFGLWFKEARALGCGTMLKQALYVFGIVAWTMGLLVATWAATGESVAWLPPFPTMLVGGWFAGFVAGAIYGGLQGRRID